jgi:hypothetical protein
MGGTGTGTPVGPVTISTFSVTRNDIIVMAFEDLGVYAPGFQTPTSGQIDTASKRLNMMIKAWQAAGVGLWLNRLTTLPLTAAAQSYLLGPTGVDCIVAGLTGKISRPLAIIEARGVTSSGTELPLNLYSRDEYMSLSLKSSTGPTTGYYYDPQIPNGVLYVWPVETDLTSVVKFTAKTPIQEFIELDDIPDFPAEWYDALHYNLALRMAPAFKIDAKQYSMIKEMAMVTLNDADGFDREQGVSIRFTANVG